MPIQMTREQYQQKYGQQPSVQSTPIKMTRSEYESKYGQKPQGGMLGTIASALNPREQALGIIKGIGSTLGGLEQLGEKMFNPIVQKVTGQKIDTGNIPKQLEKATEATTPGQKVGKTAEQIGEFFVPGGVVAKAGKVAEAGIEGAKLPSLLEKGAKLATKAGLGAAEVGGITAAQTGNIEQGKEAAKLGAILPVVGAVGGKMFQGAGDMAKSLEKFSLRLTPTQKSKLGSKVGEVADYMIGNKIVGSPETRYNKVVDIYHGMENTLQSFLNKDAKDVSAKTGDIIKSLESLKSGLSADNLNAPSIENKIDKTIEFIKSKYGESIPVSSINKLKRSAYDATYNESGMKILDPTMQHVGEVLKTSIEDATKGMKIAGKDIEGFNKEYGTVINAKKLLNIAKGRPELGFYGNWTARIFGGIIGGALGGGIPGEIVGATVGPKVAEAIAGTGARSRVGQALEYLSSKGRVTEKEAGTIKSFLLGEPKNIKLTPKEEAIAKKITEGINKSKGMGGMSISASKEAMQNTADAVYGGLKKLEKAKNVTIDDQYMIDEVTKAIEKGTQTPEQIRNAIEQLKIKGIDVGTKVDTTGAELTKPKSFKRQ